MDRRSLLGAILVSGLAVSAARAAGSGALDLGSLHGRVVLVDFWASWCGPCKMSFPYMETIQSTYRSRGFSVIAVNVDHSRERADQFLAGTRRELPVVYDPHGDIAQRFGVKAMPTSFLIGRDGRTRFVEQGFHLDRTDLYEARLLELLNEKA